MSSQSLVDRFHRPILQGQPVEIVGPKPESFTGPGCRKGDTLVRYTSFPANPVLCAKLSDIEEDIVLTCCPPTWIEPSYGEL